MLEKLTGEQIRHLGHIGFSLAEIDKMTEAEIEEHMMTPEDTENAWQDYLAARGNY